MADAFSENKNPYPLNNSEKKSHRDFVAGATEDDIEYGGEPKNGAPTEPQESTDSDSPATKESLMNRLLPNQQWQRASELNTKKEEAKKAKSDKNQEEKKIPAIEKQLEETAAKIAVKIPVFGWFLKIIGLMVRGLKFFMGEIAASYVAVFIFFFIFLFPLNILIFVGPILQLVLAIGITVGTTSLLWPHIKPFVEQAGKVLPTKK